MTSANTQQKSVSPEDQTVDGVDAKELQECEEYDVSTVEDISATASDEGSEEKEDDLKEGEVKKKDKLWPSSTGTRSMMLDVIRSNFCCRFYLL